MDYKTEAVRLIESQQAGVEARSPQWMVGEQLKDICRREPRSAELLAQDLKVDAMSIIAAEAQIKNFADSNRTGNFSCVTPVEADRILRKFYGLPAPVTEPVPEPRREIPPRPARRVLSLDDALARCGHGRSN